MQLCLSLHFCLCLHHLDIRVVHSHQLQRLKEAIVKVAHTKLIHPKNLSTLSPTKSFGWDKVLWFVNCGITKECWSWTFSQFINRCDIYQAVQVA